MNADSLIPFGKDGPDFVLMGRVGNVLFANGQDAGHDRTHSRGGRPVLPDECGQLADVQPVVRRRADEGRSPPM